MTVLEETRRREVHEAICDIHDIIERRIEPNLDDELRYADKKYGKSAYARFLDGAFKLRTLAGGSR